MDIKIASRANHENGLAVVRAWDYSRPGEKFSDPNQIKALDLPVNEFLVLHLEIECSIIEREIFTSINNHVIWAQTSRVQNILEFEIHPDCRSTYNDEFFELVRSDMIKNSKTMRQDDYRVTLPLVSMTKFSTSISIRNLINLMKYFHKLYNHSGLYLFRSAYDEIKNVVSNCGYYENHYGSWKTPKILCEDFNNSIENTKRIGNFITIQARIPMYLRAQLIRHRGLQVVDNLWQIMRISSENKNSILYSDLSMVVNVQIVGTIEMFQEVFSKRVCWIAQNNIWKDLISKVEKLIPEIKLPCHSGSCPYSEDVMLRYEGKDPNPPCPIFCKLNDLPIRNSTRDRMIEMVNADERNSDFWDAKIFENKVEN